MTASSSPTVADAIADEIRRSGPMRFDRFMELALYGPGGYYERPPVGAGPIGDFVTSPHVHPVFAQLLAEAIRGIVEAMGDPRDVELIEAGAGDGTLLRALAPELAGTVSRVVAVERSSGAREALAALDGVDVFESMPAAETPAVVLAHELLDNLPFRRLIVDDDGIRDVHVDVEDDRLVERLEPLTEPIEPAGDKAFDARPGDEIVVPTGAARFVVDALSGPPPRALLAIDYGSDAGAGGPAHGYAGHRLVEDLLASPGRNDITAGVDFGFLARHATRHGLKPMPSVSQRRALLALGLEAWLHTELERQQDLLRTGRGAEAVRAWGGRSRAALLADPAALGRFRWFLVTTPDVAEPEWLHQARVTA